MRTIENLNKANKDNVQRFVSHYIFFFVGGGGGGGRGGNDLTENKAMGPAGLRLFDLVFKWVIVSLSLYM